MRDAIEEIHRSIERIDDPLMIARLVANDSFFAIKRMFRKTFEQDFRDQILRQNIDLELDVVRGRGVDRERFFKMRTEQFAGRSAPLLSRLRDSASRSNLTDSARLPRSFLRKKNREKKMNSPPGLKLR